MSLLLVVAIALQSPVDLPRLLDELVDRSSLARFPDPPYRACMAGSADRRAPASGELGEHVLLDAQGPGAITRIWSENQRGTVRIRIDDAVQPTLVADLRALLSGAASVPRPIAAERADGGSLYLPIPFARRVRVTVDDPGVLCDVEWRSYAADTPVTSFASGDLERRRDAIARASRAWREIAAPLGDESFTFHLSRAAPESELLGNGSAATAGPRAVSEIRLRVDGTDVSQALRHCVLRLAFDGRETVAVPLGTFFGVPDEVRALKSWFLGVEPPGDFVSRWVMPYRERMTMRIENAGDPALHVTGVVRTIPWEWDERSLHFHAAWRASGPLPTRPRSSVRHLTVDGARGLIVGDLLTIANPVPGWWGEGSATISVDGRPSHRTANIAGNYGFPWRETSPFQTPLYGLTRRDGRESFGFTDLYRFRVLDAVPFTTAVRCEQDLSHTVDTTVERAACVVYYAQPGAKDDAPPVPRDPALITPQLHVRRVSGAVEAETARVVANSEGLERHMQALADIPLSGGVQVFVLARRDGEFLELEIPSEPGLRSIQVLATRGGGHGILRFSIDGQPAGERFDGRNPAGLATVGPVEVPLGQHRVGSTFRLRAEVVGTSVQTEGPQRFFGLDAVVVR